MGGSGGGKEVFSHGSLGRQKTRVVPPTSARLPKNRDNHSPVTTASFDAASYARRMLIGQGITSEWWVWSEIFATGTLFNHLNVLYPLDPIGAVLVACHQPEGISMVRR
jgi:hypothetical protein